MTARGRAALALGVLTYVAGWAFGSRPLYVVAVGLILTVLLAWLAVRLTARPAGLRRSLPAMPLEGDDVPVRVELELESKFAPAGITLVEHYKKLGARRTELRRDGRHLWARYVLEAVPRGRYAIDEAVVVVEDPFGLERREPRVTETASLVVYPRLVELERLFSEVGSHARDGRRVLLQRPSGFDLHSVRDYVEGDSLRKVHWRSTARRGQLMVKELEDAPRDDVAVVLDAWRGCPTGVFDVAVRAAGSILDAYARRSRRAALVLGGRKVEVQRVHAEGDWRRALELLAGAEADGTEPPWQLLAGERNPATLALDLVVVTARLDGGIVDRLEQRARARRNTALVYVDGTRDREPALLRLQTAGVAVAVLREGDDLAAVLGAPAFAEAARA
ncbi:MAG: DUF58 domain-containing protein [Gaiellaceae bacterium]|jgi:uncharacterized protein (DUF58 family)